MKANLKYLSPTKTGWSLIIETDEDIRKTFEDLRKKDCRIDIKEYSTKRSLNSNSLYWACIGEMASKLKISNNRCHNMMLRRYGEPIRMDESITYTLIPDTEDAENKCLEAETFHVKPTSKVVQGKDGKNYRYYAVMLGSHDMDTKQMSRLIEGLMDEMETMGLNPRKQEWLAIRTFEL